MVSQLYFNCLIQPASFRLKYIHRNTNIIISSGQLDNLDIKMKHGFTSEQPPNQNQQLLKVNDS